MRAGEAGRRCSAALACLVLLAACGARTGLDPALVDAALADAAPPSVDAARPIDAASVLDATMVPTCPPASGIGFAITSSRRIDLAGAAITDLSLAGDGRDVWVAVEHASSDTIALHALDAVAASAVPLAHVSDARLPRLAAGDGGVALAHVATRDGALVLRRFEVDGRERSIARVATPPRGVRALARPVFNGRTWVVGFTDGFEVWLGALDEATGFERWLGFGPVHEGIGLGVEPATGRTFALLRVGDASLRVFAFERDGTPIAPREGTVLDDLGWQGAPSFDARDEPFGQPFLLAGWTMDPTTSEVRFTTRAYRLDGTAGSGFSASSTASEVAHDLTTAPPAGHASGYGVIGADVVGGAWRLRHHGAGEDFVGDSRPVGSAPLGSLRVSIAPGPCGHVVIWTDPGERSVLHAALAIARPP